MDLGGRIAKGLFGLEGGGGGVTMSEGGEEIKGVEWERIERIVEGEVLPGGKKRSRLARVLGKWRENETNALGRLGIGIGGREVRE